MIKSAGLVLRMRRAILDLENKNSQAVCPDL